MDQTLFMYVGVFALLTTFAGIARLFDDATRLLSAGLSFVLWGLWAFTAEDVEQTYGCGSGQLCTTTDSYASLFYLGAFFAIVMLLFLIRHGLQLLGDGRVDVG